VFNWWTCLRLDSDHHLNAITSRSLLLQAIDTPAMPVAPPYHHQQPLRT
jgi:hypothetical protein